MPKSKHRKGQKKKANQRTAMHKAQKAKQQREFIDMIQNMQRQQAENQSNIVSSEEVDDFGIEEIGDTVEVEVDVDTDVEIEIDEQK